MKKSIVLMAMAGVALAGCVNDVADVVQKNEKVKIAFDSPVMYNNANSRAEVYGEIGNVVVDGVTYSYPQEENFIIYAMGHENAFAGWNGGSLADFSGDVLEYDERVNGWAPMHGSGYYYWNSSKKITYAATSPADLEQTNWGGTDKRTYGATGLTIPDFEVSSDASHQFDLLFSTRQCNKTSGDMSHGADNYSGLPILFQHALSSVRFSISNKSGEELYLKSITLGGVKYKGTFQENIDENTANYAQYVRGDNGNVNPEWNVTSDIITSPYQAFTGSVKFLEEPRYVSQLSAADPTNVCNQLLLMPQQLPDDAYVEVVYTVNTKENTKNVKLKDLKTVVKKTVGGVTTEEVGPPITKWEIGKRYTYRLVYSTASSAKDKIYFAPTTEGWNDVDVIVVPL